MNYRHVFHAGNACDVLKHAIVAAIVEALKAKPKPFRVLDAHAGIGLYDLSSPEAQRTREADSGIAALMAAAAPPPEIAAYLDVVRALNPGLGADGGDADGGLRWYPGSPKLIRHLLRAEDRLVANELHPDDHNALKAVFARDPQVAIRHSDAFTVLAGFVPPKERRGLVLIDPPFEDPHEFTRLPERLAAAYRRWPTGIYALWYPIKERPAVWRFHEAIEATGLSRILVAEMTHHPDDNHLRLNGSGMLIVNPPWQLDQVLERALPALHAILPGTGGEARVFWLVPEAPARKE